MSHAKRVSTRNRRGKAMPALGAAGLLALASGASAQAPVVDTSAPNTGLSYPVLLGEEEISDVSLATFYVFDKRARRHSSPGSNSSEEVVVAAVAAATAVVAAEVA